MRNAVVRTIKKMAVEDRNIILMSGDLGFGVLDDFRAEIPAQYYNAGICEQNMASMAAGLALEGKKVYMYSIGNFPTLRCIEQIRNDICYHKCNVKIIAVGGGFAYGSLGMSHHATEDIAIMRSLPNMQVFVPADAREAEMLVYKTAQIEAPCYIRLNKGGEELIHDSLDDLQNYEIGQAIQLRQGKRVCIMSTGAITVEALKAAKELEKEDIQVSVYSFPSIKPIDKETICKCANEYEHIITLEEHNIVAGFGSAVSEIVAENVSGARIIRLGLKDMYSSVVGDAAYLRHMYGMDNIAIINTIKELLRRK